MQRITEAYGAVPEVIEADDVEALRGKEGVHPSYPTHLPAPWEAERRTDCV